MYLHLWWTIPLLVIGLWVGLSAWEEYWSWSVCSFLAAALGGAFTGLTLHSWVWLIVLTAIPILAALYFWRSNAEHARRANGITAAEWRPRRY